MSKINPNKKLIRRKASNQGAILTSLKSKLDFDVGKKPFLYRFVYSSRFCVCVVFLLILSFSLQNAERVFASDEVLLQNEVNDLTQLQTDDSNLEPTLDSSEESIKSISQESDIPTEAISSSEILDTSVNSDFETQEQVNEVDNFSSSTEASADEEVDSISSTTDESVDDSQSHVDEEQFVDNAEVENHEVDNSTDDSKEDDFGTETNDIVSSSTEYIDEESTTTDEIILEELAEQQTTLETVSVTQSDSEFSFSKDECTQLATGSFYCLEPQENKLNDALFSAPDSDGDLEIFLIRDGVQVQVTSNLVDDAAPYYDKNSNTLVWHRFVNDVYQIISYDPESRQEVQLTKTAENNMEPTRQGDLIVWQRWIDNGWNIILYDGEEENQITSNNHHNVAPYIHGSLVVWNSKDQSGEKTIEMFDIKSGTYVTVDDPDGLSVSNPRMVFVYDSLHPNGDIVTKGYDVLAKKFIDLDSLPRELPEELPPSDSTGETRALIQAKPSIKSDAEESISSSTPNVLPPVPVDSASSSDLMTLDLSTSTSTDLETSTDEILTSSEFDIVIEPFINTESTSTNSVQE